MNSQEHSILKSIDLAAGPYTRSSLPTLRDVTAILFRQRKVMLVGAAAVAILVVLSGIWMPNYESQMKILVERQRSDKIVSPSADAPAQFSNEEVSEEQLNSEVELLNSSDLLRKVAIETGLAGQAGAKPEDPGTDRARDKALDKATMRLSRDLKIEPVRRANVISVTYRSSDPARAEKVLKALAAAYTEKHLEVHRPSGELRFFESQAEQYQHRKDEAEEKLTDFTRNTGVVSAQAERDEALAQAGAFQAKGRQALADLLEAERRVSTLRDQLATLNPRITTQVRTADNPQLLQQLKSTLLNLQIKRTQLLTEYDPAYRLVVEVDRQIADTKASIAAEDSKPIRDETSDQNPNYMWVQSELTKAQTSLADLRTRAAAADGLAEKYRIDAERLGQEMVEQQNLQADAQTQQQNYLLYQRKREEARVSNALDLGGILNVAVVEEPTTPTIPRRSPLGLALLTVLLMILVSFSAAFVADAMASTFRTPDEVLRFTGLPVLAALPKEIV